MTVKSGRFEVTGLAESPTMCAVNRYCGSPLKEDFLSAVQIELVTLPFKVLLAG